MIYGQSPRWDILRTIAGRDAEFALDSIQKTRPVKIAQALLNIDAGDNQSQSRQYARNEVQSEQNIIAMAIEQSPQRAIKLLRASLKKGVSYETFNLLSKVNEIDPEIANELVEDVGQKLLDTKLNEASQDTTFIQDFLGEFLSVKTAEKESTLKISNGLQQNLVEKIVKAALRPEATSYYISPSALKVIEKFSPASVTQIKQRQAKFENQNGQNQEYNKLMESNATAEELLSQAAKFPRFNRNEIYRRAAEKTATGGNIAEAQRIITTNFSEEESESYLSQMNNNLASQAISQGKFNEANQFTNQILDENFRLNMLIYLANSIYQKAPEDNKKWALSVLDQARSLIPDAPEKTEKINSLVNLAAAYAGIEPARAFSLIESLTLAVNEFSEASAIVAKFNDQGNFQQGEYQISSRSAPFTNNFANVLQKLKDKDFDRTLQFVNGFNRLDTRIGLQLQIFDFNFSNFSIENLPRGRTFSSAHKLR